MDNTTYYQRNRKILLNRAKDYYENNKERLKEQAKSKYRNVSEEDKTIKREYGKNRYHNTSEEKKQELREYLKRKYWEAKESLFKYCVYSSVKYSDLRDFLNGRFVIFRCQKYVKNGYMEMTKTIYLEPLNITYIIVV